MSDAESSSDNGAGLLLPRTQMDISAAVKSSDDGGGLLLRRRPVAELEDPETSDDDSVGLMLLPSRREAAVPLQPPPNNDVPGDDVLHFMNVHVAQCHGELLVRDSDNAVAAHPRTNTIEAVLRTALSPRDVRRTATRKADAERLVVRGFLDVQKSAVDQILADIKVHTKEFLMVSKRFDGAKHMLQYPPEMAKQLTQWNFQNLGLERFLTPDQMHELADRLKGERSGHVHILGIRASLRWGPTPSQYRNITVRPVAHQRTTCSNLTAVLDCAMPNLTAQEMVKVSVAVRLLLLHYGCDDASSNKRLGLEAVYRWRNHTNIVVIVTNCFGHKLAENAIEPCKAFGILSPSFSFVKLVRQVEYHEKWITGIAACVVIDVDWVQVDEETVDQQRRITDTVVDRICSLTIYRPFHMRSRSHPLSGRPPVDQSGVLQTIKEKVDTLKTMWHPDPDNPISLRHLCPGSGSPCPCRDRSQACVEFAGAVSDLVEYITPKSEPAENKWMSMAPLYAMLTFLAFCGNIGSKAWLLQWPLQAVQAALLAIPEEEGSYRLENTKRLKGIAEFFVDVSNLIWLSLLNVVT